MSVLAYFDPGQGSLLMQLLLGGAGGLLVFGKTLWQSWCFRNPGATEATASDTRSIV